MVQKTCKVSKSAPVDIISTMPDNVKSNILNLLPLDCAVRTSILSKNWRLNWTLLTRLVFDGEFFTKTLTCDWKILSRILLLLKDDIPKFVIEIPPRPSNTLDSEDISHLVLFLSRKGIQELTLDNKDYCRRFDLPTHIFSCVKLRHLELNYCRFPFAPSFTGFPNLLSLKLNNMLFEKRECLNFITRSSLLEILEIYVKANQGERINTGKLKNLKKLSLSVCMLDNVNSSGVFQLTEFPPKLEELTLDFFNCKFSAEAIVQNKASSVLCCLKTLNLRRVLFTSGMVGSSIFQLIFSSPNLQTLKIAAEYRLENDGPQSALSFDFNTMRQLQLQSVNLTCIRDSENEVCLIKSLLACSPVLQKMGLHFFSPPGDHNNAKLTFALKLLKLERASPIAQIEL